MSWFTYYLEEGSDKGFRPPVRRAISKFVPKNKILAGTWVSIDLNGIDISTAFNKDLQPVTDNNSMRVVYHDEFVDGNYEAVSTTIINNRLFFRTAEDHEPDVEISKKYFVYYRDKNLASLVKINGYYIPGATEPVLVVVNPIELSINDQGYYGFSFSNSDKDWENGGTQTVSAKSIFVFSGPEVEVYGSKGLDFGSARFTISPIIRNDFEILANNIDSKVIDLYSSESQKDVRIFSRNDLEYRDYTLSIENIVSSNPKSRGSRLELSRGDFTFIVSASIGEEDFYDDISFKNVKFSGSKKVTLQNLKPGREYILTVRSKNTDYNISSNLSKSIRFTVPSDSSIPEEVINLELFSTLQTVMFKFDPISDLDVKSYEYELYDGNSTSSNKLLFGSNEANIFTVSVNNLKNSNEEGFIQYWGRVRSVDTTGNKSEWTPLVASSIEAPLIGEQYVGTLSAGKITAGTIGSHTITLNGANSIIQSSTYASGSAGWRINGLGNAEFNSIDAKGSVTAESFVLFDSDSQSYNGLGTNALQFINIDSDTYVQLDFPEASTTSSATLTSGGTTLKPSGSGGGLSSPSSIGGLPEFDNDQYTRTSTYLNLFHSDSGVSGSTTNTGTYDSRIQWSRGEYFYPAGHPDSGLQPHSLILNGPSPSVNDITVGSDFFGGYPGYLSFYSESKLGFTQTNLFSGGAPFRDFNNTSLYWSAIDNGSGLSLSGGTRNVTSADKVIASGASSQLISRSGQSYSVINLNVQESSNPLASISMSTYRDGFGSGPSLTIERSSTKDGVYVSGNLYLSNAEATGQITITNGSPQIKFNDTTAGADDFWIHINSNRFYILADRNDDNIWDGAYPLELNADTNVGYVFGSQISVDGHTHAYAATNHTHSYAATDHNHTYNVNNAWLRDNGDDAHVKLYGNSRQMVFRTDGTTEYATGVSTFAFLWMYGGDASGNRRMGLNSSGQLWCSNYGYLHEAFYGGSGNGAGRRIFIQSTQPSGSNGDIWIKP